MEPYGFGSWNVPRRGILKVHGENGAQSLQMQPDDNCIALDETNPEGKTNGEPPPSMLAVYDYLHEKQIEHSGAVKAMQALYMGR